MNDKAKTILRAALKVFSDKGFAGARVEEIARKADVGKGTVYEYFASKEHLFEQTLIYALDTYVGILEDALTSGATLRDSLQQALIASFRLTDGHRPLAQVLMDNPTGGPSPDLRLAMLKLQQRAVDAVAQTIRRHQASKETTYDPQLAARMFIGIVQALSFARLILAEETASPSPTAPDIAGAAIDLLLRGLEP